MGASLLSSEVSILSKLLAWKARRLDLGTTYAVQEGKLKVKAYRNVRTNAPNETVHGGSWVM